MPLPKPSEVLRREERRSLPKPSEVLGREQRTSLPSPSEVLGSREERVREQARQLTQAIAAERQRQEGGFGIPRAVRQTQPGGPASALFAESPLVQRVQEAVEQRRETQPAQQPEEREPALLRALSRPVEVIERLAARIVDPFDIGGEIMEYAERRGIPIFDPTGIMRRVYSEPETPAERAADIAGQIVGYAIPGAAIERAAARALAPAIRSLPRPAQLGITGATAGATEMAIQEGVDVAARGEQFDPRSVAIGAGIGGAVGVATPIVGRAISALGRRLSPARETATEAFERAAEAAEEATALPTPEEAFQRRTRAAVRAEAAPGERRFIRTLEESDRLQEPVEEALAVSPARQYEPITNRETLERANRRIAQGVDEAEAYVLRGTGRLTAEQVATGMRLIDVFQQNQQYERAVTLVERLAERLTEAGQAIQAVSIWNRLTPEGALLAARRKVAEINRNLPKYERPVELTADDARDIMTAAQAIQRSGASRERAAQVIDIADRIRAGQTISDEERQILSDFIKDLSQYVKPGKDRPPRPARMPKEMQEPRIRDRVVAFFDAQEQAARERLRARGIRISSMPLDVWADYTIIGASKLAKGVVRFADWSEEMIREFGEEIRPFLRDLYERAQDIFTENTRRISRQAVSRAERIAENYLTKNADRLPPEDVEFIRTLARQVSELSGEAQRMASQDLQAILNSFERAGVGRKIAAVQYISLLLNPVTQIRNILGNELLYRLERISRILATPIDIAASKLTGKERVVTFRSGPLTWENFFRPSLDYLRGLRVGIQAGFRGVNVEGLTTTYDIRGQAFQSKLNPLTYLEKTLNAVLRGFDYAAYNRAVNQRLREMAYLDAINRGITGRENIQRHIDRYVANIDDNIAAIAKEYGRFVTLQDDTMLSRGLMAAKRMLNRLTTFGATQEFGAGSLIIPFARTPANLLLRALDYSPAGFVKAIYQAGRILLQREVDLTRADVIQSVTRAIMGTGLTGVAYWLADKGVIRGSSPFDRDVRQLERQAGLTQFQLNASAFQRMLTALVTGNLQDIDEAAKLRPGDILWQYEWAQPISVPIAVGANIAQEQAKEALEVALGRREPPDRVEQVSNVVLGALNTLMNTSVLRGLQEAFEIPYGEENKIKAFAMNVVRQIPSQAVPTFVSQINRFLDRYERETYSPDTMESLLNVARARIPGLAQQLPVRVTTLGQHVERRLNFFEAFLLPFQATRFEPTEEAKIVMDLLSTTGDERIAPRVVQRFITGRERGTGLQRRVELTGEQFVRYQTIVGQEVAKRLGRIPPNASTERKIELIIKALNDAGEVGRRQMRRELGLRPR